MKKIISIILLAAMFIGVMALAACQPPKTDTDTTMETDTTATSSNEPASDTDLNTAEQVPAGNTQGQN